MTRESEFSERLDLQVSGHTMVTDRGDVVGRVSEVVLDETADIDAWAVVETGLLQSEHFVPLDNAYLADDGHVVVPYDKHTIRHAPRARDHVLVPTLRRDLATYYGTT